MAIISIGYHNRLSHMEWQPWHHPVAADAKLQWRWWDICHTCQLNLWDSPSHSRHLWFRLSSTCPEKKSPWKMAWCNGWNCQENLTALNFSSTYLPLSLSPSPSRGYRPISVCFLYSSYTYHIYISHYIIYIYISLSLSLSLSPSLSLGAKSWPQQNHKTSSVKTRHPKPPKPASSENSIKAYQMECVYIWHWSKALAEAMSQMSIDGLP